MATQAEDGTRARRYKVRHAVSEYTFPSDSRVVNARVDDEFIHVELEDGRRLSIPLTWIPSLSDASPDARAKFRINSARTSIVWNPDESGINDELCVADFLVSDPPKSA